MLTLPKYNKNISNMKHTKHHAISMIRKNITFGGRFPDHAEGEL